MKLPIPTDWNGEDWQCVQIHWPNSPHWIAFLNGWLSAFQRGRLWNEETGSILAVQLIGQEIWARNAALESCDGTPVNPPDEPGGTQFGCGALCWEDDMPCIDISNLIKIENGRLWVRDACCVWVDLGSIAGQNDTPGDDPETPPADYACRKAYTVVNALWSIAQYFCSLYDTYGNHFTQALGPFKGLYGFINWDTGALQVAYAHCGPDYETAEGFTLHAPAAAMQSVICGLSPQLSEDTLSWTTDELGALSTLLSANLEANMASVIRNIVIAAGVVGLGWLSLDAEAESSADCDCPDDSEGLIIFLSNIVKTAGDGAVSIALSEGRSKCAFTWFQDTYSASCDWQGTLGVECSQAITTLTMRVEGTNGDNPPTTEWEETPPYTIAVPNFGVGPSLVETLEAGALYRVYRLTFSPAVVLTGLAASFKWPGRYPPSPDTLTWFYKILSAT